MRHEDRLQYQAGFSAGFRDARAGKSENPAKSDITYREGYIEGYDRAIVLQIRPSRKAARAKSQF